MNDLGVEFAPSKVNKTQQNVKRNSAYSNICGVLFL